MPFPLRGACHAFAAADARVPPPPPRSPELFPSSPNPPPGLIRVKAPAFASVLKGAYLALAAAVLRQCCT
jgi:hypothetical protein